MPKSLSAPALLTAFAASLCCIGPFLALAAGIGGASAAFSWAAPLRPYLAAVTVAVLVWAWVRQLRAPVDEDCACETATPPFTQTRGFLGLVTAFAALTLSFPLYANALYSDPEPSEGPASAITSAQVTTVTLGVKGMTCAGCEAHVTRALSAVPGVQSSEASFANANATVHYDAAVTEIGAITTAINATGYQVLDR